jgi:hypothetical protein
MDRVRPQPAPAAARRRSIFAEVGLLDEAKIQHERSPAPALVSAQTIKPFRPARIVRFRSRNSVFGPDNQDDESDWESLSDKHDDYKDSTPPTHPPLQHTMASSRLYRAGLFVIVLALMLPILQIISIAPLGVYAAELNSDTFSLVSRADAPTDVCKRWSGQSTIVNGTLYMYGFRTATSSKQNSDTWSKSPLSHATQRTLTPSSQRFPNS